MCGNHEFNPGGAVGGSWDQIWSSWALLGPLGTQKGHFGPKVALLGPLGAQKKADTRPKCVVTMSLTQAEQPVAVGTKSGPFGALKSFSPS